MSDILTGKPHIYTKYKMKSPRPDSKISERLYMSFEQKQELLKKREEQASE